MAALSDLKEVKEALDAGLVSQAEFDDVKLEYLKAKKEAYEFQKKELRAKEEALEFQKKELRAQEEALEANKDFQKRELRIKEDFQKKELIAKEAFQQRKSEAELRALALDSFVKHGSSTMSEEQKVGLARDYVRMTGLDRSAENYEPASKRQRASSEERSAAAPQTAAPPAPADAPTLFFSRSTLAERDAWNGVERAAAPVASAEAGKGLNESSIPNMRRITALLSNCCDEPGKSCAEMKNAPPASAPEPETKNAGKSKKKPKRAMLAYNFFVSQKWGELRKKKYPDLDHIAAAKQLGIMWKEASDAEKAPFEAMAKKDKTRYEKEKEPAAAAASKIAPPESAPETETVGKSKKKSKKDKDENKPKRCKSAYLFFLVQKRGEVKEKYPELDNTAAMKQLGMMWKEASDAEKAPFEAMAKEDKERYEEEINQYAKEKEPAAAAASGEDDSKDRYWQPWSVEEDQTLIQAHREGKTHREIAAMLPPGRTKKAVEKRWGDAKKGKQGTAALRAYAAEYCKNHLRSISRE